MASVSKRVFGQNLSYESEADLHENEATGGTHFHLNLTRFDTEARSNSDMAHLIRNTSSICLCTVVTQDVSNLLKLFYDPYLALAYSIYFFK